MTKLTPQQIKEIAGQLDCGFRCFWNMKDYNLIFIPDLLKNPEIDMNAWAEDLAILDNSADDFKEFPSLESSDSFEIMEQFVDQLPNTLHLKEKLIGALNMKHPFRNFKFIIDGSGEYRQQWFSFKDQWLHNWVLSHFELMNQ